MPPARLSWDLGDEIVNRLEQALEIREEYFAALAESRKGDPFRTLVAVILSQNTNEANTWRAYKKLGETVGINPRALISAPLQAIEEAIKPAGLQQAKSRAIKQAAEVFARRENATLRELANELLQIRGIGYKTIDVVLAMYGEPVLPIDTHIRRVAERLGIGKGGYRKLQESLHAVFRPEKRLKAHLLLIALGREICKARNPLCGRCPLQDICAYRASQAIR